MKEELGVIIRNALVFGTYKIDVPDLEQKIILEAGDTVTVP